MDVQADLSLRWAHIILLPLSCFGSYLFATTELLRVIYIDVHTLYVPSKTFKTLPGEGKKGWIVELHVRSAFLLVVLFHMALF